MADQSFLQRGLTGFRDTMRNVGRAAGRAAQGAAKKAKAQMGNVKKSAGFSDVDAYNADEDEQNRKKRAQRFFGDDEPSFVGVRTDGDPRRDLSTVAPEFRAQVSAGLAGANSQTSGSTLVDRGGGGDSGNW